MRFSSTFVVFSILQAASTVSANCAANNCVRAIKAHGLADCSSYLMVTEDPAATATPTTLPSYATPCSNIAKYSSACSCLRVTRGTTTAGTGTLSSTSTGSTLPTTDTVSSSSSSTSISTSNNVTTTETSTSSTSTFISKSIDTASGYVIVSPTSCPSSGPTGALIGKSDTNFTNANGGFQYQQYPNSQLIIQNNGTGPIFVDLSQPDMVSMSDSEGDTLILYANGTFEAFAGNCELEIVGSWNASSVNGSSRAKRNELVTHESSELCNAAQLYCNSKYSVFINGAAGSAVCAFLGAEIGADVGGAIGFLGNVLGPEVGIPTTLLGVVLGARLGAFLAGKIGQTLCGGATSLLGDALCHACPPTCGIGQLSCNGGPCIDVLSDPNNCGGCGITCPSGVCQNAQCSAPTCDGSTCSSLNGCGSGCFCFETSDGTGFCGPNTACSPLADCGSTSDCARGEVCATGTCCGRNVCLGSCSIEVRRTLEFRGNSTQLFTGGKPPIGFA